MLDLQPLIPLEIQTPLKGNHLSRNLLGELVKAACASLPHQNPVRVELPKYPRHWQQFPADTLVALTFWR